MDEVIHVESEASVSTDGAGTSTEKRKPPGPEGEPLAGVGQFAGGGPFIARHLWDDEVAGVHKASLSLELGVLACDGGAVPRIGRRSPK